VLEEYLDRADVSLLMNRIGNNEKYYKKTIDESFLSLASNKDIALFVFYDALFKFKVVIADNNLLTFFLLDLEKLFKKIDNFQDLSMGVNELICKIVAEKLNIKSLDDELSKKEIVSFVFNRFIVDGYYIFGFDNRYSNQIKASGLVPGNYNSYDKINQINNIFEKYEVFDFFDKNSFEKNICYTDSFLLGCYYSLYFPSYFYNSLLNNAYFDSNYRRDKSLKDNYFSMSRSLKRFMNSINVNDREQKFILDTISDMWRLLDNKNISVLVVKRRNIKNIDNDLDDFMNNGDVYESVDRILNGKYTSIHSDVSLYNNYEVIDLNYFKELDIVSIKDEKDDTKGEFKLVFNNAYGQASIFIIIGSLLVSFGVIIMIFLIIGGSL